MSIIRFVLTGDSKSLDSAISNAKKNLADIKKEFREGVETAAKWGAGVAAAAIAATAAMVKSGAEIGRELRIMADNSNATLKEFQRMAVGARSVGIEQDKVADILKDVNDRVGDFLQTGAGPMADFFENIAPKVGVTADQFRKLSGPQALQLYVDSLQKAGVSQQEMTFYMEAMASDATALIPILRDGGAEMNRQADEAERLGLILSDIDAARLEQAGKAMSEGAQTAAAFKNELAANLSPIVVALNNLFKEQTEELGGVGEAADKAYGFMVESAAFAIDAVDGLKRVTTVVADGMIIAFSKVSQYIADYLGFQLKMISKLPGVDFSETIAGLENFSENAKGVVSEAMDNIGATLDKPLPSGQFRRWVSEAEESSKAAAEAVVAARAEMANAGGGETGGGMGEAERKRLAEQLEAIRQANLTEIELLKEKQEAEAEVLAQAREEALITDAEYKEMLKENEARFQKDIEDIKKKAADAQNRLEEQKAKARESILKGALSAATTLMNSESRKMFEIGKVAAIAQSLIATWQGASEALKLGWPLGPPAAAAIAAAGLANVANIRAQSFGGGGGGSGAASNTQAVNAGTEAAQPVTQRNIAISLQGDTFGRAQVRDLMGSIGEELDDNVNFAVT